MRAKPLLYSILPWLLPGFVMYYLVSGSFQTIRHLSTRSIGLGSVGRYAPDPLFAEIARGGAPPSWGINYIAWSGSLSRPSDSSQFREVYEVWRAQAQRVLQGTGSFVYPFSALHISVSTPAPFPHAGHSSWNPNEREQYRAAWVAALSEPTSCRRSEPFLLRFKSLRFSPDGTAIVLWDDATGAIAEIRKCVAERVLTHPALTDTRIASLLKSSGLKTPSIIHSTILRLALPRDQGMSEQELVALWDKAASLWPSRPLSITSSSMFLVMGNEVVTLSTAPHENVILRHSNEDGIKTK